MGSFSLRMRDLILKFLAQLLCVNFTLKSCSTLNTGDQWALIK